MRASSTLILSAALFACRGERPKDLLNAPSVSEISGIYIDTYGGQTLVLSSKGSYALTYPPRPEEIHGTWTIISYPHHYAVEFSALPEKRLSLQLLRCGENLCMPADITEHYFIRQRR